MGFLSNLLGGKTKTVPTSSSTSSTRSVGSSSSAARSRTEVFAPDFFTQLFGNASNAAGRAAAAVPGLQGQAAALFSSGTGFLEQLMGPGAVDERLADTGTEDEQIASLGSDLARFFSEELNPRIGSRGVAAGQYGGARGEVAQGIAARGLAEEFARGSTAIRAAGTARRDALASTADSLRLSAAGTGLSSLQGLYGLADAGAGAELGPYLQLAQILGGPTLLDSSEAFSSAAEQSVGTSSSSGSTVTRGPGLLDVVNSFANLLPG